MATLSVQSILDAGTKPTSVTAGATDRADVGSGTNTFLRYTNTTGSPVTVTVAGAGTTSYGVTKPSNGPLTLAATTGELWIPLRKEYDQGDGLGASMTVSAPGAGISVSVLRFS